MSLHFQNLLAKYVVYSHTEERINLETFFALHKWTAYRDEGAQKVDMNIEFFGLKRIASDLLE